VKPTAHFFCQGVSVITDITDITISNVRRFVASVWLVHGLYNKLLGGSPRHLAIVQEVPGLSGATGVRLLAAVGLCEVALALWVLSGRAPRRCATAQTAVLLSMNLVELTFARRLLLWPAGLLPMNTGFLALAWIAAGSRWPFALNARLKRHPIPIDAHIDDCLTLTYALPEETLRPLLPRGLELDTFGGYGFVAVALVQTRSLRPAGFPPGCGQDFFLAGYRVFTTFRTADGRTLRGLRILRSDADRWTMVAGGNALTHYNYHLCDVAIDKSPDRLRIAVTTPDSTGSLDVDADLTDTRLPAGSPFTSLQDARRFAGPLPFTFDYESESDAVVAIRARRSAWRPGSVAVDVRRMAFFEQPIFRECTPILAAAFHVKDVDYRWERGVLHWLAAPQQVAS
jgi:uncharacterized membrane protein YphA (DoxX/SURF4 family)